MITKKREDLNPKVNSHWPTFYSRVQVLEGYNLKKQLLGGILYEHQYNSS